jgi:transcriptional regulator with XRE-family HTH domain
MPDQDRLRFLIESLGMSQIAAADFLGKDHRTFRRWIEGKPPAPLPTLMLLELMHARHIKPDVVQALMKRLGYS